MFRYFSTHELVILTKFHGYRTKIVDFLQWTYFELGSIFSWQSLFQPIASVRRASILNVSSHKQLQITQQHTERARMSPAKQGLFSIIHFHPKWKSFFISSWLHVIFKSIKLAFMSHFRAQKKLWLHTLQLKILRNCFAQNKVVKCRGDVPIYGKLVWYKSRRKENARFWSSVPKWQASI